MSIFPVLVFVSLKTLILLVIIFVTDANYFCSFSRYELGFFWFIANNLAKKTLTRKKNLYEFTEVCTSLTSPQEEPQDTNT
jgi:hypothetical protein